MAGVKGKSGGPRRNAGGKREGAGRKPAPPTFLDVGHHADPLEFLRSVMQDANADMKLRLDAAKSLMPFIHARKSDAGTKEQAQTAAKKAGAGKFAASQAPRLIVNNGKLNQ